jgi:anthranilate synthase/aminodeoxychorismate synthase-like glutamine amidotransferase
MRVTDAPRPEQDAYAGPMPETRLVLVDNYDSFVYNLAQALGAMGTEPVVVRNDCSVQELAALGPDGLVISPGPGGPEDAGVSIPAVRELGARVPILGVCLGHQCIAAAFGAVVERAPVGPVHGKTSWVSHDGTGAFADLPAPFEATRYHSLAVRERDLPRDLEITARSEDDTIMGLRHASRPVEGVQFHPESVLTGDGDALLANWLRAVQARMEPATA